MTMTARLRRLTVGLACGAALASSVVLTVPVAGADSCPPGHVNNRYSGQCFLQGSAPVINGVTCTAGHLGLCQSFIQNRQPPKRP
jgi:hypothetical protein